MNVVSSLGYIWSSGQSSAGFGDDHFQPSSYACAANNAESFLFSAYFIFSILYSRECHDLFIFCFGVNVRFCVSLGLRVGHSWLPDHG